ncbi:hypothetical protein DPMN_060899 [Dreissena polymorpha]|uniref:VWF/SSPO/Zonadhesin-like cysteine-rich domain-containing protein n=1 Tax=Dreissena polymorpha TaxID=45954 RepID=A0A9D4HGD5_DREPO|nr:hypothetical protein DPMN_060899 [Dreissena polymorpha]
MYKWAQIVPVLFLQVHPLIWYETCATAFCEAKTPEEKQEVKCASIEAYARELATASKPISWRNAFTCRKEL